MREFKTVFVLEVITGVCLRKSSTFRGLVEVIAYLGGMGEPENVSSEQFGLFWKFNEKIIISEILKQIPALSSVYSDFLKVDDILKGEEWLSWAEDKIMLLGDKVTLSPIKDEIIKVLPPQSPILN